MQNFKPIRVVATSVSHDDGIDPPSKPEEILVLIDVPDDKPKQPSVSTPQRTKKSGGRLQHQEDDWEVQPVVNTPPKDSRKNPRRALTVKEMRKNSMRDRSKHTTDEILPAPLLTKDSPLVGGNKDKSPKVGDKKKDPKNTIFFMAWKVVSTDAFILISPSDPGPPLYVEKAELGKVLKLYYKEMTMHFMGHLQDHHIDLSIYETGGSQSSTAPPRIPKFI